MILDKKGKLFGRISIFDVLVIVIIALVAVVGYKYLKSDNSTPFTAKNDKLQIVFYQEEAPEFAAKAVKAGDVARESLQNASFGTVVDVKTDKSVSWVKTSKGEYVKSSREGYASIYVTMEGSGIYGNNGVKIGGGDYYIGQTITLYVGNSAFYGKIYDIQKK